MFSEAVEILIFIAVFLVLGHFGIGPLRDKNRG